MSTPTKEDLLRLKIIKARRTLAEAEKMIEFNFANAGVNRLYYACFYAASALLFSKDIFTKTHSGVKQQLGLHFIKTGLIPSNLGQFYSDILRLREDTDYDDNTDAQLSLVKELAILANQFVDKSQSILNL